MRTVGWKIGVLAVSFWLFALGTSASADALRAAYERQAGYALHLLESGRYGEAEDAAQALVIAYPDASLPYALRGTTALYIGSLGFARKDFRRAANIAAEPAALYGLALCDLFAHDTPEAASRLTKIQSLPNLTVAQGADLATAQAYLAYLRGEPTKAGSDPSAEAVDPLRCEIDALAMLRSDPKAGALRLARFLSTPDGVPVVHEQEGVRPLFDPDAPLEPGVIQPSLQQMYADRLTGSLTAALRQGGQEPSCSGVVDLNPPQTLPSRTAILSYSVDGQIAAMVNQPPFTFTWDTAHVANGPHTVQIQAVDSLGNALITQTETIRVSNRSSDASRPATGPDSEALQARLWSLLKLRPCRKVAEWALAEHLKAAGDKNAAETHLAVAAALDLHYRNGAKAAQALFGPPARLGSVRGGSGKGKRVALTFDDGPSLTKTPALLDALDKAQAPATFFVVGSRAAAAPEMLRRMARRGDEVENHSDTHPNMNLLLPSEAESEIVRGSVVIQALAGRQPHFFRPPGGNATAAVRRLAQNYGLCVAYWSVDALHAEDLGSPSGLTSYILARVHPGSIVLMHNGPEVTTSAIPSLVAGLRARGYTLVTLSEITRGLTNTSAKAGPKLKE